MTENTFPEWSHKYVSKRAYPSYGPKAYIMVTAGLHYLRGNSRPYFTVTSEIWERPNARDCVSCGCQHEEVLKFWSKLAPVVALHLSDDRGLPMHLEENGLCWLGFGKYSKLDYKIAAEHFRVSVEEVTRLREDIISGSGYDRTKYLIWIAQQKPRYHREADAAIALLDQLISEQGN